MESFLSIFFNPEFEEQTKFENYLTDDPYLKLLAGFGFVLVNAFRAHETMQQTSH
jgi:hypothetical protein